MKDGVFWIVFKRGSIEQETNEIIYVFDGVLSHSDIWKSVIKEKKEFAKFEYDFFPRGRIWIKDGKAIIFIDKKINTPNVITQINQIFCLNGNYEIHTDG